MNRRPPPYAKRLREMLADRSRWPSYVGTSPNGRHLTLWLLAGTKSWKQAKDWEHTRRLFLLAPPDDDPQAFDWSLLAGHDPVLLMPCGDLFHSTELAIVSAVMRDGTERVLRSGTPRRYVREVQHAA